MHHLLHILLTAIILGCPYACCPAGIAHQMTGKCCCQCGSQSAEAPSREKQPPASPAPCKAKDCLCGGAVLTQPVELPADHYLSTQHVDAGNDFLLDGLAACATTLPPFCRPHATACSSGRELRLAIDSLLI
jgi:hypothetical protein